LKCILKGPKGGLMLAYLICLLTIFTRIPLSLDFNAETFTLETQQEGNSNDTEVTDILVPQRHLL